jgi:hypothetical protein
MGGDRGTKICSSISLSALLPRYKLGLQYPTNIASDALGTRNENEKQQPRIAAHTQQKGKKKIRTLQH